MEVIANDLVASLFLGLIYAFPAIGLMLLLRFADFPDLSIEGSFALGAVISLLLSASFSPWLAMPIASLCGAVVGVLVGVIYAASRCSKFFAAIVGMSISLPMSRLLGGPLVLIEPNKTIFAQIIPFDEALHSLLFVNRSTTTIPFIEVAMVLALAVFGALFIHLLFNKTRTGLAMRSLARHPDLIRRIGLSPSALMIYLLAIGGCLSALGGAIFAQHQKGFDASLGLGAIFVALISVMLGEEISRRLPLTICDRPITHVVTVIVGAIVYQFLILIVSLFVLRFDLFKISSNILGLLTGLGLALLVLLRRQHVTHAVEER